MQRVTKYTMATAFNTFLGIHRFLLLPTLVLSFTHSPKNRLYRSRINRSRINRSRISPRILKTSLFGTHLSLNNDDANEALPALPTTIRKLKWNLRSILSAEKVKLIPLIDVYNAAERIEANSFIDQIESITYGHNLPAEVAPFRRFVRNYNYDMGHDGRFTIFGSEGASLQPGVVFSMDEPLSFIRDVLSNCGPNVIGYPRSNEAVVFAPGSHTFHEHKFDQQRTSNERAMYYSRVLGGLPMAQIHTGTCLDRGDINIEVTTDTVEALKSHGLIDLTEDYDQVNVMDRTKTTIRLGAKDRDLIRMAISGADNVPFHVPEREGDSELRRTMRRLIDSAILSVKNDVEQPHLVLMTYSATSHVLVAALREWKQEATTGPNEIEEEEAEHLLHEAVTVVTIGALSQDFIDGPAYIHLSMIDDTLTSFLGVSEKDPKGGGNGAVYLHALSPYAMSSSDDTFMNTDAIHMNEAHNLDSCAIQFLSLIMRVNGITSFRKLYEMANDFSNKLDINQALLAIRFSETELEIPPKLDEELLPAMIYATGGDDWMWNPDLRDDSILPSENYAESFLQYQFGYSAYDEIVEMCGLDGTANEIL